MMMIFYLLLLFKAHRDHKVNPESQEPQETQEPQLSVETQDNSLVSNYSLSYRFRLQTHGHGEFTISGLCNALWWIQ